MSRHANGRALFVLGAPRSGTSLVGRFLGSHPECCNLGEYYAFYLALDRAPGMMATEKSPVREDFLQRLADIPESFADERCASQGSRFWCDRTPMNLEVAELLARRIPGATFVLTLRHYRGAVLSLRNLFAEGSTWAGRQLEDSAKLWARYYSRVSALPTDRTFVVSYESLCEFPEESISRIEREIAFHFDIDPNGFDRGLLTARRSTGGQTIAEGVGRNVTFRSIESYDLGKWSEGMEAVCQQHVSEVDAALRERFGTVYHHRTGVG